MKNKIPYVVLIAIVAILSAMTYQRNKVWQSAESLWRDAMKKAPEKSRPRINYAAEMMQQGRLEEAVYELKEALRRDPRSTEAMNNLGAIYTAQGRYDEAQKVFFELIRIGGSTEREIGITASAHNNLGVILVQKGAIGEATIHFEKAVELNPEFDQATQNLALLKTINTPTGR